MISSAATTTLPSLEELRAAFAREREARLEAERLLAQSEEAFSLAKIEREELSRGKHDLLRNMGHELRTPLNAIIGFSSLLLSRLNGRLAPEDFDYLQITHDNANDLMHIVNQALEMTRLQSGSYIIEKDNVQLEPIIESCLAMRQQQFADAEIVPIVEIAPDLPDVVADRAALAKCLLAIIDNAIKFSDGAPQILVSADRVDQEVVIMVADRGIGIPEPDIDRVTEPFFQVDNTLSKDKSGAGLGLAITRSLLERQDARLKIMSHLGHGTTVHIRLKRA
ncbi:sensor histidine kinase [Dongia sp.]|uniref:sensor histidine kinase n=1 Tax=Dongia sp. TaxID=1977262 RepID=UPI00375156E5